MGRPAATGAGDSVALHQRPVHHFQSSDLPLPGQARRFLTLSPTPERVPPARFPQTIAPPPFPFPRATQTKAPGPVLGGVEFLFLSATQRWEQDPAPRNPSLTDSASQEKRAVSIPLVVPLVPLVVQARRDNTPESSPIPF